MEDTGIPVWKRQNGGGGAIKMTRMTKFALYFLRFYLIFLFGLIIFKFCKGF